MEEIWRTIPGFPLYEASSFGRICSTRYGRRRIMKIDSKICNSGYKVACLGAKVTKLVHILVATTFFGDANGREVNHKDGNKLNNHLSNLEWVSSRENKLHAYRSGLHIPYKRRLGFDSPIAKLTVDDVDLIYEWHRAGFSTRALGRAFGVSKTCITDSLKRRQACLIQSKLAL